MKKMLAELSDIVRYRELLRNLVVRDIKVRYKRSVLGFVWVMLNPLLMMGLLYMVFSGIFKVATENYLAYLLSGITLWNFFAQGTSTAVHSLTGNSNLLKKVCVPKAIFPLSVILSAMVNFLFSLVPLAAILVVTGTTIGLHVFLLPIILLLVFLFSFGVALIISTLTVFFQDTIYIYDVVLMGWMYITPIFYPESIIPRTFMAVFQLNPFYSYLTLFRGMLYMDSPLSMERLAYASLYSFAALFIGWALYTGARDKIIYYL